METINNLALALIVLINAAGVVRIANFFLSMIWHPDESKQNLRGAADTFIFMVIASGVFSIVPWFTSYLK